MTNAGRLATALLIVAATLAPIARTDARRRDTPSQDRDQAALDDFARRTRAYAELHRQLAFTVPELRPAASAAEIRQAADALATAITAARRGACAGDIFAPDIAALFRRLVRKGCQARFYELLAIVNEDLDEPLPPAAVHARWPIGAPLPTMPPDLLAALPPLPAELEYRFISRDLVLRDVDANLIVDFVPDAIPVDLTRR